MQKEYIFWCIIQNNSCPSYPKLTTSDCSILAGSNWIRHLSFFFFFTFSPKVFAGVVPLVQGAVSS